MPRIYPNAKDKVEDCLKLAIFAFNKKGSFKSSNSGALSWVNKSSIAYEINVDRFTPDWEYSTPYLNLSYSITDNQNKQKNINQTFYLSRTPCNFGEERFWFICSCGKRVGVLYKPYFSDTFACRHCFNLTYKSRNFSGILRKVGLPLSKEELDSLGDSIKRVYYKGKLTKKYIKYDRKYRQHKTFFETWLNDLRMTVKELTRK